MIRPLRQQHRWMVCTLGVVLPVAFATGIAARKPLLVAGPVAEEFARPTRDFGRIVWTKSDAWPDKKIITSLRRDTKGSVAVELTFRDLAKPDVLVYWAQGKPASDGELPEDARLLGPLAMRVPLAIPSEIRGRTGHFVLYSLAQHEVVTRSKAFIIQQD